MYAYTTRVTLYPGQVATGVQGWREQLLPWLRQQPGFRRLIVLTDHDTNRGMAIIYWDSKSDFEAVRSGFRALAAEHLHPFVDPQGTDLVEDFAVELDEAV